MKGFSHVIYVTSNNTINAVKNGDYDKKDED